MKTNKGRPIINTPIRTRENSQNIAIKPHPLTPTRLNKENNPLAAHLLHPHSGLSPNKIAATRKPQVVGGKPLIQHYNTLPAVVPPHETQQPVRKASSNKVNLASSRRKQCANHPDKEAEFRITIEGEAMLYCSKCSAHLASQGFSVERLNRLTGPRPSLPAGSTPINLLLAQPTHPKMDPSICSHPRFLQISSFLEHISSVGNCLRQNSQAFSSLSSHYNEQCHLLEQFYDAMAEYMRHIKTQHINLVRNESRKFVQIGEIECGEIEENMAELEYIGNDMQGNINSIVKEIGEDKYRECFNFYSQKVELYKHRAEEQEASLSEVTRITKEELESKLNEFRNTVNDIFGIKEAPGTTSIQQNIQQTNAQSAPMGQRFNPGSTIKKLQGPQSHRPTSNGPFRNLFQQEESLQNQGLPDQSPQFKNI